jgi:hypothetical protein
MLIPKYEAWLKQTSVTIWRRDRDLQEVDKRILAYQNAKSQYGQDWETKELSVAFKAWKKNNPDWRNSKRNENFALSKLQTALTMFEFDHPPAWPVKEDSASATNLRHGTLYFLSQCKPLKVPTDWDSWFNDAVGAASDVHDLVETAKRAHDEGTGAADFVSSAHGEAGRDGATGFLKSLYEQLKDYLGGLVNLSGASAWCTQAGQFILDHLPELLKTVLGAVAKNFSAAVDVIKGLAQATRAALAVFSSRNLEEGIISGHPRNIIGSVRDQIKAGGWDGIKSAVKASVLAAIGTLNPIAGVVCSAVASVYGFVTDMYGRIKDRFKLNAIFADAKEKLSHNLHKDPQNFNDWFLKAISDLPVLSSYVLSMPMTGGYYGFLTLVGTNGTEISYRHLEANYAEFNDVKKWAKGFVQGDKIKLESEDPIVKLSLKVARDEVVMRETDDRQIEEASSLSALIKGRLVTTAKGMVETLAS